MRAIDAAQLDATTVFSAGEPLLVRGGVESWPASSRWGSPAALRQHYGYLVFDVAPGLRLSLDEFLDFDASLASPSGLSSTTVTNSGQ